MHHNFRPRFAGLCACLLLCASTANAAPSALHDDSPAASLSNPIGITLTTSRIFERSGQRGGITELVIRIDNTNATAVSGTVEILAGTRSSQAVGRATFSLRGNDSTSVVLPVATSRVLYGAEVRAILADGLEVGRHSITSESAAASIGIAFATSSTKAAAALRGSGYATNTSYGVGWQISVGQAERDPVSGRLVLPQTMAGYAGLDLVIADAAALAAQDALHKDALYSWIQMGGTLAVLAGTDSDVGDPFFSTLVGGTIRADNEPPVWVLDVATHAPDKSAVAGPSGGEDSERAKNPIKLDDTIAASAGVTLYAKTYRGGTLATTPFGTAAVFGTGRVIFLGFSPEARESDPWTQGRIVDLARESSKIHKRNVIRVGENDVDNEWQFRDLRKFLDPNESFRFALALAGIVLVIYAVVVGPVLYGRAKRRQKLFEPFMTVPLVSIGTFLLIVTIGFSFRGFRAGARRLTLLETASGSDTAAALRFRGFYTSSSSALSIHGVAPASVLDVSEGSHDQESGGTVRMDREGMRLDDLHPAPWSTLVVRDVAPKTALGRVTIRKTKETFSVQNAMAYTLRDMLLWDGDGNVHFTPTLAPGAEFVASASTARPMGPAENTSEMTSALSLSSLDTTLPRDDARRFHATWAPLEQTTSATDVYPHGVPMLLATVEGMKTDMRDGDVRLMRDTTLLRVIGQEVQP